MTAEAIAGREFVALVITTALEGDGSTPYMPDVTPEDAARYVLEAFDREGLRVVAVPRMPKAQRGAKVDHAVELVSDAIGRQGLRSLCGTLEPMWSPNPIAVDVLPAFDPEADDACRGCRRRLPPEFRPNDELEPRRARRRAAVDLDGYRVNGRGAVEALDVSGHPSTLRRVFEFDTADQGPDLWPTLGELVRAARDHATGEGET